MAATHSKTKFNEKWMDFKDGNGDLYRIWCKPSQTSPFDATCMLCSCTINVSYSGIRALQAHSKSKKHSLKANVTKPLSSKSQFTQPTLGMMIAMKAPSQDEAESQPREGEPTVTTTDPPPSKKPVDVKPTVNQYVNMQEQARKAEVRWALKCAISNYSFASNDQIGSLFQDMFPDSVIAKNFKMAQTKTSYVISHGLGPYFQQQMINDVISSECYFTLHFDETVTSHSKKQMDILIRYFSATSNRVQVRFLSALMFGHAYAETVVKELLALLQNLKLPLARLLSIASDGPNVNKSIKNKLDNAVLKERPSGLVHTGFCVLHIIHNAVKAGNERFGQKALEFTMDVYQHFHMYPAREEDYAQLQENLDLEDESNQNIVPGLKFLRHVDSRWLTLLPAVQRVHQQLPLLVKYFKEFLPKNDKGIQSNARYKRISQKLHGEYIELQAELHFLEDIKPLFDKYLTLLQSEGPMIHTLYPILCELMKTLLGRFVKQENIPATGTRLCFVNTSIKNQLSDKELVIGVGTKLCLDEMKPEKRKVCLLAIRSFFSTTTDYLMTHLPLDDIILKAAVVADPQMRKMKSKTSVEKIKILCEKLPCCSAAESSSAIDEWKLFVEDKLPHEWENLPADTYWAKVSSLLNACGYPKYNILPKLMKCCLTLAHGNADTERSLSRNKKVLTKERVALSAKTLIGIRHVQDAIKTLGDGNPCKIALTPDMMRLCKGAFIAYEHEMKEMKEKELQAKKAKEAEEMEKKKTAEEERKRQAQVRNITDKNKEVDEEMKKVEDQFQEAESLAKESGIRMQKALKEKDMSGISVAHELQEIARNRSVNARENMEKLNRKKRKLIEQLEKYAKKKRV